MVDHNVLGQQGRLQHAMIKIALVISYKNKHMHAMCEINGRNILYVFQVKIKKSFHPNVVIWIKPFKLIGYYYLF